MIMAALVASWVGLRAPMAYEIPLLTFVDFEWHVDEQTREVPDQPTLQRFVSEWVEREAEVAIYTAWRAGHQAVHIRLSGKFAAAPQLAAALKSEFPVLAKASVEIGEERDRIAGTMGGWLGLHHDARGTEARSKALNELMSRHGRRATACMFVP
ncbi:MAG: hypothetical protein AAF735_02940 [Myxococcota bacterium]